MWVITSFLSYAVMMTQDEPLWIADVSDYV